jgi:hypothetical protein
VLGVSRSRQPYTPSLPLAVLAQSERTQVPLVRNKQVQHG